MDRAALRTKSVATKVTEEECSCLERLAAASGQSVSEWCRDVLLKRAKGRTASEPVTLAELLALRTILLNLFYALSRGEEITGEQMRRDHRPGRRGETEEGFRTAGGDHGRQAGGVSMSQEWGRESYAGTGRARNR